MDTSPDTFPDLHRLGTILRTTREAKHVSVRKMALACNISAPYLSKLERGLDFPPSVETLKLLARELDLDALMLVRLAKGERCPCCGNRWSLENGAS